jgi:hypothetical protein
VPFEIGLDHDQPQVQIIGPPPGRPSIGAFILSTIGGILVPLGLNISLCLVVVTVDRTLTFFLRLGHSAQSQPELLVDFGLMVGLLDS